ncbi:MAG: hypothetical protein KGO47_09400 [Cyanobacteria bacterium REEB417]|nr:hypothetical protein [Cyanobacteria bacterium REEB417]
MPTLRPIASEPIAIRQALEEGWRGFRRSAPALIGFTLLLGGANLLSWLVYRQSGGLLNRGWLQGSGLELVKALGSLITYLFTGLWLLAGLVRGAEQSLEGGQVRLVNLLRGDARAVTRLAWSGLVLLLLLALVVQSGEISSWLLTLVLPRLTSLPLWAARAVVVYLLVDQVLLLPIVVVGRQSGLAAFRSGRRVTDPHWLQALGLLVVVGLILLAGFLLLVALAAALPLALCTLTAAYRQLFALPMAAAAGEPTPPN